MRANFKPINSFSTYRVSTFVAERKLPYPIEHYQKKYVNITPVVQQPLRVNVSPAPVFPSLSRPRSLKENSSRFGGASFLKPDNSRRLDMKRWFSSTPDDNNKNEKQQKLSLSEEDAQKKQVDNKTQTSEKVVKFVLTVILTIVLVPWLYAFGVIMMWFTICIIALLINLPFY